MYALPVERKKQSENVQAATSEAHELLKKEIAAATAEENADVQEAAPEELSSFRDLQAERHRMRMEEPEPEDDGPVEIKKMAMPMLSAAQLAEKAKKSRRHAGYCKRFCYQGHAFRLFRYYRSG